jgi:polyisoprenoid-binding protein YceI
LNAAALAAALAALAAGAPPPGARVLAVDAGASSIRYFVVHKLHHVDGRSTRVEGKALVSPDGKVQAMVRVPAASFDSGDGNRDAHMQEALEVGTFPFVTVKAVGVLPAGALDRPRPATVPLTLTAEVDLHGVKVAQEVPVQVTFEAGGAVHATGTFDVSLDAHAVERPALLFVKIEDACRIELDLVLREVAP